jgi:germination protein M
MTSRTGTGTQRSRRAAASAIAVAAVGSLSLGAAGCTEDESAAPTSVAPTSVPTTAPVPVPTQPDAAAPATPTPSTTAATPTPSTTAATTAPPTAPATNGAGTTITPAESMVVSAYFVRDDRIGTGHRIIERTVATSQAALDLLLAGPTAAEGEIGFDTAIPAATTLESVSIGPAGIATVELSPDFEEGGGSLAMRLRLAQVVFTVTQFATVSGVNFLNDGAPIEVFGSEGIVLDHPLTRADFEELTPALFVEGPGPFDVVGRQFRVHGTANVFEATFMVRLTDGEGTVVYEGSHMATSGTGTRGTFDLTIDTTGAPTGVAELRLWESSAQDGSDVNVVTIPLELTD